jgi:hypothetical protein
MQTFQILMVGPSRVGKTSTLASMSKGLQNAVNTLQYHTTIPPELQKILRDFEKTLENNETFTVTQQPIRTGTASNNPYEITFFPQGSNEDRDITLQFIDVPGGWYCPPTQENPNPNYNTAKEHLSQSIISFWCIDCVSMIEANSKYHEDRNAPDYITDFYKDVSLPKGHRIVFVLMRAETYIRDKKRGVEWLMGKGGEFDKHYGKCINELKETLNGVECFVTYVETLGCVQFTYYSEKDNKVEAVYAIKGKEYDPKNCEVPALLAIDKSLQEATVFYENEANKILKYFNKLKTGFWGWLVRSPLCLVGVDINKHARANTIVELIQKGKPIDPQEYSKEFNEHPFINAHIVCERLKNAKPKITLLVDKVHNDGRMRLM